MRKISPIGALAYIAAMAALLIVLIPGLASASASDIWSVVSRANQDNQQVLNSFASTAVGASDVATLDSLRSNADASLDEIYTTAAAEIQGHVDADPGLAQEADGALAQLLRDHYAAHAEVDDIYRAVRDVLDPPPPTTTTTTVPPTTTTTTVPPTTTTTTTAPPTTTTTTTTAPPTTTTTTTTVPPTTTTTTTVPPTTTVTIELIDEATTTSVATDDVDADDAVSAPAPGDGEPPAGQSGTNGMLDHIRGIGEAQLWSEPVSTEAGVAAEVGVEPLPPTSSALSEAAAVLLPPAVVTAIVAPILVVEVLARTLVDSARSLAVPVIVLTVAMAWFLWREQRATRVASQPPM